MGYKEVEALRSEREIASGGKSEGERGVPSTVVMFNVSCDFFSLLALLTPVYFHFTNDCCGAALIVPSYMAPLLYFI